MCASTAIPPSVSPTNQMHTTMTDKTYLTSDYSVLTSSIVEHATTETSKDGYITTNGDTSVTLCTGMTEAGNILVCANTNGGPVLLVEGEEAEFLALISDQDDGESDLSTGYTRLTDLVDWMRSKGHTADWLSERVKIMADLLSAEEIE